LEKKLKKRTVAPNWDIEENMIFTINNSLGEVVQKMPVVSSAITIYLERLPAGLYNLFVVENRQIVFAEKFVKTTD
jgi:hypothetical protein